MPGWYHEVCGAACQGGTMRCVVPYCAIIYLPKDTSRSVLIYHLTHLAVMTLSSLCRLSTNFCSSSSLSSLACSISRTLRSFSSAFSFSLEMNNSKKTQFHFIAQGTDTARSCFPRAQVQIHCYPSFGSTSGMQSEA